MLKAYKYRLYPNLEQREYLVKTFGCTRFIYNKMLADKIEYYKETGEMLKNTPAQYKKEFEWLKEVDSLALANAQQNLEKAYKNFFRDKSIGFPKFKSKKTNYYSYTTNNQKGTVYIENNHVKIPKLKTMIKIKYHREFTGVIKSCTISKTPSNKYFISILVDTENKTLPKVDKKIGVDVGLKDFLHKLSTKLIRENQSIAMEDLRVKNMLKNNKLSKAISEVSWYEFRTMLEYKADWYGRTIVVAPTNYASSQLCSECGYKNIDVKNLALRNWICPNCGADHDRDVNASKNLEKLIA